MLTQPTPTDTKQGLLHLPTHLIFQQLAVIPLSARLTVDCN